MISSYRWCLHALIGCLVASPGIMAAQAAPRGVTLAQAVAGALSRNPDLLLADAATDSARAERRIAAEFPNPVLSGTPNSPYQYAAAVPLDVTPRRSLRIRVAAIGASATAADRRDAQRQTTLAVVRAFFDALLADQRRDAATARQDVIRQILAGDSVRFRSGDLGEHSLQRSEIELIRADADVARAAVDVERARIALQSVIGVEHPDSAYAAIGSLDYRPVSLPDSDLVAIARSHRPDLLATQQRVEQNRTAQRSVSMLLFPTPELTYVRQFGAPFDNGRYYSLGLAFELPSVNLYRGERERAAVAERASQIAQDRAEAQIERDVILALADFHAQRALVERYASGVLARTDAMLESEQYAYSRGAASLLEVLDALQARQDVQSEYALALHDYWVSAYALNAATGTQLVAFQP